ncbi:LCP family protein [Arthrobacter sp. ISL-30]|uniref:LCP family protein n=1 Tax=Arthrobacter sp. ISL-30 TaxID=2819109 RepID=UPI001BE99357|nr:LCP family protein [Arthrobacter sp. ISL-30]MBT2515485.1 LCP family protein [Arthrobacter sp. ISL-30]
MSSAANGPEPTPAGGGQGRRRPLLGAALALLLVLGVVVAAVVFNAPRSSSPETAPTTTSATPTPTPTTETPTPPPPPPPPPPPTLPDLAPAPMNVLLIGSDIRGVARDVVDRFNTTGERLDTRADIMMLIHIPADRHRIYGISIMRDTWVNIPGYGASKINTSLDVGGPGKVVETIGGLLGTKIDHFVMTDFGGFRNLTDALGGVDVNVTVPFTSTHETFHSFPPGINHLNGQAALEFVRERYAFTDGDYQRVRNQQTYVRSLMAAVVGKLGDPVGAINMVNTLAPHVIVEPGFDMTAMATLAYALRGIDPAAALFITLPTAGTGFSADGQSIVIPDYGGIGEVAAALANGTLDQYAAARGL